MRLIRILHTIVTPQALKHETTDNWGADHCSGVRWLCYSHVRALTGGPPPWRPPRLYIENADVAESC